MSDAERLQPLLLDMLEGLASGPRSYDTVLDAWRTSCPRLPVWETALDEGYLRRAWHPDDGATVEITESGRRFLEQHGRARRVMVAG